MKKKKKKRRKGIWGLDIREIEWKKKDDLI